VKEPRCLHRVKGQPPVDSSVGRCPGESCQLRRIDNTGLAQSGVRRCIVEERIRAKNTQVTLTVAERRVISSEGRGWGRVSPKSFPYPPPVPTTPSPKTLRERNRCGSATPAEQDFRSGLGMFADKGWVAIAARSPRGTALRSSQVRMVNPIEGRP